MMQIRIKKKIFKTPRLSLSLRLNHFQYIQNKVLVAVYDDTASNDQKNHDSIMSMM